MGCHRGSGGIAMAKGDKNGKYKNESRRKSRRRDQKRDRIHNSKGEKYERKVSWKKSDEAQIRKGRSNAPKDLKEIAEKELNALNERKGRGRPFGIAPIVLTVIWSYYCSLTSHTFRSVQGWSEESLAERFGVKVPQYSTMCKYSKEMCAGASPAAASLKGRPMTVAVDSTGIGSRWAGLWRYFLWGSTRGWLKLHAMVDVETGVVIAYAVSGDKKGDSKMLLDLVDMAVSSGFVLEKVLADGAYDTYANWNGMDERGITFIANIRDNAAANSKCPTRTKHVKYIREHGKKRWHEETGYTMRWKAETAFSSLKKLFGEMLRAKKAEGLGIELDGRIEQYNSYKVRCHAN